ncbi:hypothetical protein D3C73_614590 [compost metagenome]
MRFTSRRQRRISCHIQNKAVSLSRGMKLIVKFLYVSKAQGCHNSDHHMPNPLTVQ